MHRRRFIRAAGVAGVAGLAGCNGSSGSETETDDGDTVTDTATDDGAGTPTTTTRPGGDVGETLKIGVLGPADSPLGEGMFNAAKLAARERNNAGGVAGADVAVVTKDTKDNPSTAGSKYQELVAGEQVDVTTGVFGSESLLAIMDDIANSRTVHLTTGALTAEASAKVANNYEKYRYHFRPGPLNSAQLARSLLEFGRREFGERGWDRVAILTEDYEWTKPIREQLATKLADAAGVEVVLNRNVAAGTRDFTPVFDEIGTAGADVAITALAHLAVRAMVQWAQQRRPFEFGGINVVARLPSILIQRENPGVHAGRESRTL